MLFRLLADATVVLHVVFVVFVLLGGLLAVHRPAVAWAHLPAAIWGAWVELAGWICPLTPLENWFRERSGRPPYASGFVEHYVVPLLYPSALSRELQWAFGGMVVLLNVIIYAVAVRRWRSGRSRQRPAPASTRLRE